MQGFRIMRDKEFKLGQLGSRHWVQLHAKLLSQIGLSIYPWLLKHALSFPDPVKRPRGVGKGKMGLCYENAANLVLRRPSGELHYCEGFAIPKTMFPMEHAWCIDNEGRVIDPTWDDATDYYGAIFQRQFVKSEMLRTEYYGILHRRPNLMLFSEAQLCINDSIIGTLHDAYRKGSHKSKAPKNK